MALLLWKAFDFFQVHPVKLEDDDRSLDISDVSSVCAGSDSLFLGSDNGFVYIVGPSWKVIRNFRAHDTDRITHMRQVEGTSLLLTISEDLSSEPLLRVWALDKIVKKTGLPTCLSEIRINNGHKQFPISAFTALDDLSQLAVGFANGSVTVVRGDLINDLGTRQRIVHEGEEPITGVEFVVNAGKTTTLFVATTSKLLKLLISGKGQWQAARTVEDAGCAAGCMTVNKKTGDIIVVREDAVYYYTQEGRGLCFANDGDTRMVSAYKDYIGLVSVPSVSRNGPTKNMGRSFGGSNAEALFNQSTFSMVDPTLQIVAHSETLISQVKAIFQIWGDVFVLMQDGKINRYHEKPLQQRLELLFQRNLYPLAINLAQKAGMDGTQQNAIYRKYGDYLYQKGDYDSAMSQYIKAIDSTEPSQVIRKFLDTQRIHNLIEYLEELHEHHKATADHTTLLLNCYAKLKDVEKLEAFIKSPGDLKFDLDTAITMCRQGGYFEQAAYLATMHGESELVTDILIEDSKQYADALDYIWHLDVDTAYTCLMKYATVLLENCASETTKLFIEYYTGKYKPKVHVIPIAPEPEQKGGMVAAAGHAVQNLTTLLPLPYMNSSAVPTPGTQGNAQTTVSDAEAVIELGNASEPDYKPPPPRTAFSAFIDHSDNFIAFIEACLEADCFGEQDKADLYTTLFEMYLHKASERKGVRREEWEAKAKKLIEGQDLPIENSNILLLSHLSDFRDGTTLVKEQSGLLFDIFRSYTSAKDTRGAIKALRKYGGMEPQLYPAALAYFTSDARILDEAGPEELESVLQKIDEDGLMAPLQVIQTLGANTVATMGMIKPYLSETIARERREIAANKRQCNSFRKETAQKLDEIKELGTKPAVFQAQRCPGCGGALELPVVHFLCKHSFHQRCLKQQAGTEGGDGAAAGDATGSECPVCSMNNSAVRAMKTRQDEWSTRHDLFKDALEKGGKGGAGAGGQAEDRFKTVAGWFGQGVMGVSTLE
ncbi:putative PEP5 protein [Microdochium bolleyi]|uniref:E3 ubiquitin-protein ligase PEP5 n=1 Tax=Microdochium bolleyi TaxID=196109 RepID=A0A136INZ2_9PEZI|nr:putative PEP5 protein [Microdochium bolleyi]